VRARHGAGFGLPPWHGRSTVRRRGHPSSASPLDLTPEAPSRAADPLRLQKASTIFHRLATTCGETRSRWGKPHAPGRTLPSGAAGRLGFGRVEAVVTGSPMEGTSGAADLALLRGRVGDAALGSRCVRASDAPCAAALRARRKTGAGVSCRRPRASGSPWARELRPFAGAGVREVGSWRFVLSGTSYPYRSRRCVVRNAGVSIRWSSDLTTRGVRADRVGVAPAPGRPKGQARERARRAGASRAMESSDTPAAGWWGLPT